MLKTILLLLTCFLSTILSQEQEYRINWCRTWEVIEARCDPYGCAVGERPNHNTPISAFNSVLGSTNDLNSTMTLTGTWGFVGPSQTSAITNPWLCFLMGIQPPGTFVPALSSIILPWGCDNQQGRSTTTTVSAISIYGLTKRRWVPYYDTHGQTYFIAHLTIESNILGGSCTFKLSTLH